MAMYRIILLELLLRVCYYYTIIGLEAVQLESNNFIILHCYCVDW